MLLSSFPRITYWRNCFFFSLCIFASLFIDWLWTIWVYFWVPYFVHWPMCLLLYQYYTVLMTIALYYNLKSGNVYLQLCSFFSIALTLQDLLQFRINFCIICFSSVKKVMNIFIDWICRLLWVYEYFNNINSLNPRTISITFPYFI